MKGDLSVENAYLSVEGCSKSNVVEVGKYYRLSEITARCFNYRLCKNPIDLIEDMIDKIGEEKYFAVQYKELTPEAKKGPENRRKNGIVKICKMLALNELVDEGIQYLKDMAVSMQRKQKDIGDKYTENIDDYSESKDRCNMEMFYNTFDDHNFLFSSGSKCIASNYKDQSTAITTGVATIAANAGEKSKTISTGYFNAAVNSGENAIAISNGYECLAAVTDGYSASVVNGTSNVAICMDNSYARADGERSLAVGFGHDSMVRATLGSWIVLAEWDDSGDYIGYIKNVRLAKVDGKRIKADTYYQLIDNKFVQAY
jgi:hypothetical protein